MLAQQFASLFLSFLSSELNYIQPTSFKQMTELHQQVFPFTFNIYSPYPVMCKAYPISKVIKTISLLSYNLI